MPSKNGSNGHKPGVSLARLSADRKEVQVQVGDEVINVTYRPRWFSALTESRFREAAAADFHALAAIQMFVDFVVDWDVVDDEGKVIPITVEALQPVPTVILTDIFARVQEDLRPNVRSGEPSAAD